MNNNDINDYLKSVGYVPLTDEPLFDTDDQFLMNLMQNDQKLFGPDNKIFYMNSQRTLVSEPKDNDFVRKNNKYYTKKDLKKTHSFSDSHLEQVNQEPGEFPRHYPVKSQLVNTDNTEFMSDLYVSDVDPIVLKEPTYINGKVYPEGTIILRKKDRQK